MNIRGARILHISKYYYPFLGGTEQVARDVVQVLAEAGAKQKVICFHEGTRDQTDFVDGIEIIRVGCFAKVASQALSWSYGKQLREVISSFRPDVIIFHYPNPFAAAFLLGYLPKNCRLVIYWHLDIVKQRVLKQFFIRQNKLLVKRADVIIATSPPYVDGSPWLSSAGDKCVVVPNCINTERLQSSPAVEKKAEEIRLTNQDKIICLAVGRHTEYKGFLYLIRAAHLLDDRFRIYIAGKGEETDKLKREAGNDRKICFLGPIDDVELIGFFTAMDIFCFPSVTRNEAFGIALAEAMYFGKPAVTFTIPGSGVNFVSIDGVTGIEVENRNTEQYAEAIRKLAEDRELRIRLGNEGKKRVMENFLNSQFQENILAVLERL